MLKTYENIKVDFLRLYSQIDPNNIQKLYLLLEIKIVKKSLLVRIKYIIDEVVYLMIDTLSFLS